MAQTQHFSDSAPPSATTRIHNVRVYILALVASMGAVMFGYDLAFIGTTISLGSFKKGVGSASGLVPLFVSESSPPAIRGRLVGIYEIGVQLGTLIGFWINYGVNQHVATGKQQYTIPFAFQLIPGGLLLIGIFFVPESPRWVGRAKGKEATLDVLSRFRQLPRDHPFVQEEAAMIIAQIEEELHMVRKGGLVGEFQELFGQPLNRRRITLGVLIFTFMQFAGSNAINYYSPRIFASIGLGGTSTTLISTGVYGSVRFVTVCIAMYFLVDRFGRTSLLLIGSAGMAVCMYYIGGYVQANPTNTSGETHLTAGSTVAAVAVYVYAVFFSLSWAGVPWIYAAEMYPTVVRSLAVSICTATHWLFNFVIARSVPYMISNIKGGTYFLFAACLTLSIPFVWIWLPETKGRRLEDMDIMFLTAHRNKFLRIIGGEENRQEESEGLGTEKPTVAMQEIV